MDEIKIKPKELMKCLTLGVAATLEKRPGVGDIKISNNSAAEKTSVIGWEQKNSCMLPDDLKSFYQTTNGLLLTWKVVGSNSSNPPIPIGRMEINPIEKLERVSSCTTSETITNKISLADADYHTDSESEDTYGNDHKLPHFDSRTKSFELDPCGGCGKVCLVYNATKSGSSKKSEVWFLDRSMKWYFISSDFTTYYRLMLMHLGLPHWQYTFTPYGLPLKSKQWYNLYAPIRLKLEGGDLQPEDSREEGKVAKIDFSRVFKGKPPPASDKSKQKSTTNHKKKASLLQNSSRSSVPTLRGGSRAIKPWT